MSEEAKAPGVYDDCIIKDPDHYYLLVDRTNPEETIQRLKREIKSFGDKGKRGRKNDDNIYDYIVGNNIDEKEANLNELRKEENECLESCTKGYMCPRMALFYASFLWSKVNSDTDHYFIFKDQMPPYKALLKAGLIGKVARSTWFRNVNELHKYY